MHQAVELCSNALPKAQHFFNSAHVLGMVLRIEAQHGFDLGRNCDEPHRAGLEHGQSNRSKRTGKGENGNEVGRIAKNWGVRRVGTEAQAGLPVLLENKGARLDARGAWMAWMCTTRFRARRAVPLLEEN